jgi:HD-GYP domain-containing protein (c-di-GMP phosphodiesterase class II)
MERHPVIGWEILRDIDFLGDAKLVVRHHHERWDGAGYPDGLGGEEIPPAARLFAVADTLDALTTDRPYRPAGAFADARALIGAGSGAQFCPASVDALGSVSDERLEELRAGIT